MNGNKKYEALINYLKKLEKVCIAFSGGVDSTFLLKAAHDALNDNVLAVSINSPYMAQWEIKEAKEFTHGLGVQHHVLDVGIIDEIRDNPQDRCYLCKKYLFNNMIDYSKKNGYHHVLDGTNADDTKDYRPGLRALRDLNVISPLLECDITKDEVREMSKALGLDVWQKPASACLLTRLPHNTVIKEDVLASIEEAERFMIELGFAKVRVRVHDRLARIEVAPEKRSEIFNDELTEKINSKFKMCGFEYTAVDILGYRTGSFNEKEKKK